MSITLDDQFPCATASALRQAYVNLVAGDKPVEVIFRAGPSGVERSVTYNKADPDRLLMIVREWEQKCAAAQGKRPRRFAMRSGGTF